MQDNTTSGLGKVINEFDKFEKRVGRGINNIKDGAVGLVSSGYAIENLLGPSIDMSRALGEVASLDVSNEVLKKLQRESLKTSIQFGNSATDMVRSAYDIQSAISGLESNELAAFTRSSNILALGTKSDAATITDYMGTMYGIFKNSADAMGKAVWVELLTGQTAAAVKMFKTTGAEMAGAFTSLGAEAQSAGISLSEQIGILGTLQATMSGSEAGTKYRAFLAGVGNAQKQLGLEFTDSHGRLLPMVNILEKLRGKFGETFDVAESDTLKKAFGSTEATGLIKLLMADLGGLSKSIKDINNISGQANAEEMAKLIADPWERAGASVTALKTIMGNIIQPILIPMVELFISAATKLTEWAERYPFLTKVIGITVLGVLSLAAAVSAVSVAIGVSKLAFSSWALITGKAQAVMWLFNLSLWASPITWFVVGIAAVSAGLYFLITNFGAVKSAVIDFFGAAYGKWQAFREIIENNLFLKVLFAPLLNVVDVVTFVVGVLQKIPQWFLSTKDFFSNFNFFEFIAVIPVYLQEMLLKGVSLIIGFRSRVISIIENNAFLRFAFAPLLLGLKVIDFAVEKIMCIPRTYDRAKQYLSSIDIFESIKGFATATFDYLSRGWDQFESMIRNNAFLRFAFAPLLAGIDVAKYVLENFEKIPKWWQQLKTRLSELNPFAEVEKKIKSLLLIVDKIPGVDLGINVNSNNDNQSPLGANESEQVGRGIFVKNEVPRGGILSEVTNNRGTHIEKLEVNTNGGVDAFNLMNALKMQAS